MREESLTLVERLQGLYMNRATLISTVNISVYSYPLYLLSNLGSFQSTEELAAFGIVTFGCGLSGGVLTGTWFGNGTAQAYKRTKKHILKNSRLDPRAIKALVGKNNDDKEVGYCELQGVYLAAKELEQLGAFYTGKEKYTKIHAPNF